MNYKIIILIILLIIILEIYCYNKNKSFHEILYPNDYNIIFNEEKYKPTNDLDNYYKIVNNGYNIMKTKKIVIGGLFKDSAHIFNKFKNKINNLSNYFIDIQIVIFENDSTDNSRILLLNWEKEQNNVHIIKCIENNFCLLNNKSAIKHGILSENRMKKMIKYRNIIKKYIDDNFSDYDYFMNIDTDTKGSFSMNGLAYSFGTDTEWDIISAYGIAGIVLTGSKLLYYDYIAYLNNFISFNSFKNFININSIKNTGLFKVDHAFGGLSIYKMSSIKNADYTPLDKKYICEHTIFSNNIKKNGYNNFYINTYLIFLVGKQGPEYFFFY